MMSRSDERLKTHIRAIENPLDENRRLDGYECDWTDPTIGTSGSVGVIAQDVQEVFPTSVQEGVDGTLRVDYNALIPFIVVGRPRT